MNLSRVKDYIKCKIQGNHQEKREHSGWKCMPFIIGMETFEKLATFGVTANLAVYLVRHFHMKQVDAVNLTNIFFGTANFAPLLGAFISDAYLGRFCTLMFSSVACFLGMIIMVLSASVPQLQSPSCSQLDQQAGHCIGPSKSQTGVLLLALSFLVIGSGGVRPCSLPFGVDQFDQTTDEGRQSLNGYFNWYYGTVTAALMVAITVVIYIQDISFTLGFSIPAGFMLLSIILFFLGCRLYVYAPPEGSVFSGIFQVFAASFKKRKLEAPSLHDAQLYDPPEGNRIMKLSLCSQFGFLNKAAVISDGDKKQDGCSINPWRLCSIQQIEEVKCLLRIVPIWFTGLICFLALAQQWTFIVLQAMKMERHLGPHFQIPPGCLVVISMFTLTVFISIYDRLLVPFARKFTKLESGITLLQRQGIGLLITIPSMIVAGLVERKRRHWALRHANAVPLSALWLIPQLVLLGIAEAFNLIGQIEFYNRQFPEQMQTLASSLFFCSFAGASYLSSFLVGIVRKQTSWLDNNIDNGRLDYYYYLIAILGVVNLLYFLVVAQFYRYKGMQSPIHVMDSATP